MDSREEFLQLQGQTSPYPFLIEVDRAEGSYIYDREGKAYLDMISGVAVNNIGHGHPRVLDALQKQIQRHLHVMVYGEFVQEAPLEMARELHKILPNALDCVYPVNSGTEAVEAALKLTKRVTGRQELVAFKGSYHGSTHGSMSVSYNEGKKSTFRPLLPGVRFIELNKKEDLQWITTKTAGVILETIQGDAGVRIPEQSYIKLLRERCDEVGALLILDEIQCGLGRSGKYFAFEHFGIVPDILTLGKALGGGMPIGALISSKEKLQQFTEKPVLGHITTFGGHPVNCAAAAAFLKVLQEEIELNEVESKGSWLEAQLSKRPEVKDIRRVGLMFAIDMESADRVDRLVKKCLEKGLISFWFLSHPYSFRLSPPLNITKKELEEAAAIIIESIEESK
ncbi:MAG: aspartate aminotransferase family protein [Bacteroidetes bacterium]|nr:MAG: aspartate aminotransferase family protein [Bacteroidota bacterium]